MAWVYLVIAGVFEWGWPIGLKFGWTDEGFRLWPTLLAVVCMGFSGALLLMAQREIPVGTAYAVWTGIGAVGAFLLGIAFLGDSPAMMRFFGVGLIIAGIVTLKMAS